MTVTVRPMRWWDVSAVAAMERELFADDTWSERVFWSELAQVDTRHYAVAVDAADAADGTVDTGAGGQAGAAGSRVDTGDTVDTTGDTVDTVDAAGATAGTAGGAEAANAVAGRGRGQEVVGYAGLAVYADEAHVLTLGVRGDRQGRGVGALLLRDLLDHARARHVRRVLLEVRAGNVPAERLYARHGFTPIGIRRRYYQPSGADAVVMVRDG